MDEQTYLSQVSECERSLYRIARSILWNDADSADAVQQAVFRGWQKRWQLRDPNRFRAWLTGILIHECRNIQRRAQRQKKILDALEGDIRDISPAARDEALEQALRDLPERYRLPVLLHYMEGYPIRDIAKMLGLTEGRVSSRLYRARRKLEEALKL